MLFLFRFALYYLGSIVSFGILSIPGVWFVNAVVLRFLERYGTVRMLAQSELLWLFIFLGVAGTFLVLLWDTITGATIHRLLGTASEVTHESTPYETEYTLLRNAMERFGVSNIRLYVNDDENANAYAIQNPTRRVVVLTRGLLESFSHLWTTEESDSEKSENDLANYSHAVAGIIGHELSHLTHTDNLPAWVLNGAFHFAQSISRVSVAFVSIGAGFAAFIPIVGPIFAVLVRLSALLVFNSVVFINYWLVMKPLQALDALPMRMVENRCDRESGEKLDGQSILIGLFSLAVTHEPQGWTPLADHPPNIPRVARAYRRLNSAGHAAINRFSAVLARVNRFIAVVAIAAAFLFSASLALAAMVRMDWIEPPSQSVIWTTVDENANQLAAGAASASDQVITTRMALMELRGPLTWGWQMLGKIGVDALDFVTIGSEGRSEFIVSFAGLLTVGAALTIIRHVVAWLKPIVGALLMLPALVVVRSKENREEETPIDEFFFSAIDAKSVVSILSLLRNGANPTTLRDGVSPFEYAQRNGRYYILPYLR